VAGKVQPDASATDQANDDIQREAERTRQRIAALERMKEEEAKRLAQTEAQRRREARRNGPRQGLLMLPPGEIERRIAALREQQRRLIGEMMRRQMAGMDAMQRRQLQEFNAFRQRFADGANGAGFPGFPGFPAAPSMFGPGQGQPVPGAGQGDRTFRTPDGSRGRFREFQGPNGFSGFEMHWQSTPDTPPPPVPVPAPPKPGRVFD
jgi:hypothetical protein